MKGNITESLADGWAENINEHKEGLDKLKNGMMPLKRNWEYTYFLFVEENNFPSMLHKAITC